MSSIVNKVKEALHSDKHEETGTHASHNAPEGTHGPHGSRVANAADPRFDSDRDHRAAPAGAGIAGTHAGTHTGTHAGAHTGTHTGYSDPEGTHGPHGSRVANAADPRFDSDRDHRAAPGGVGNAQFESGPGTSHVGGGPGASHVGGASHLGGGPGPAPNTAGPHKKDLMNKADPRVDSDLDASKTFGGNKTLS